jgi:hypothetical protein
MRKIAILLALVMSVGCTESTSMQESPQTTQDVTTNTTPDTTPAEAVSASAVTEPEREPIPPPEGITWLVEPVFDYGHIWYCNNCDKFSETGEYRFIDEKTGEITDEFHGPHCGSSFVWIYDPQKNLLGSYHSGVDTGRVVLYPKAEFTKKFPEAINHIMIVHEVDSSMVVSIDYNLGQEELDRLPKEAFLGKSAVAYNGEFVTGFDFYVQTHVDGFLDSGHDRRVSDFVSLEKDGKYGIIDKNGETAIPFILDEIFLINNETAFAKHDGKYGIIKIGK